MSSKKQIDSIKYFQDNNYSFVTSGKNVGKKSVCNIKCISCDDSSQHLSVSPVGFLKCWRCGYSSHISKLVEKINDCKWFEAKEILKKYETNEEVRISYELEQEIERPETFIYPYGFDDFLQDIHKEYLESRDFDVNELCKNYGLKSCLNRNSAFKYRIIIPLKQNGITVNFIGRDVTNRQEPKYKDCPEKLVVIPKRDIVFNIDNIKQNGTMVITEGPLDVFRGGNGFVSTNSINFTSAQINLIRQKDPKRIFLAYDNEELAQDKATQLEASLYFCKDINYIELPDYAGDICDLKEDDIKSLRRDIF